MSRLSQQPGREESEYILVAHLFNTRNLSNILKAIHFKETSTCYISSNGMKVTVEDAKCVQANAFIQSGIFQEFNFKEDSTTFRINMNILMGCLNIFGPAKDNSGMIAMKMCYAGYGSPLKLILEEGGVITDCSIQTEEPDEALDFNFISSNVVNKIIMKSLGLKEAFSELDMTSEVLEILMSPDSPYFRMSTFGHAGSAHKQPETKGREMFLRSMQNIFPTRTDLEEYVIRGTGHCLLLVCLWRENRRGPYWSDMDLVDYPKDSDMVESFECTKTQTNRYKITLLKSSTKALNISSKISIRMDNRGFLSMQYMILNDDGVACYVEYLCAPDEECEDDDDYGTE